MGSVQELPKMSKFADNFGFWPPEADTMNTFRLNLACTCRLGSALGHQIWPSSVKRGGYRSPPKCQQFAPNCGFWPPEADTMNTFRWNLACKCIPWLCSSTANLALIGKRGSVQEPPKCQNLPKIVVLATEADTVNAFRWNLAWQCRPWVCSSTPNLALIGKRGWVQESPKYQKLPIIMVFGLWKPTQWTHLLRSALRDTALCTLTHHWLACRTTSHLIDWRESYGCLTHERELYVGL